MRLLITFLLALRSVFGLENGSYYLRMDPYLHMNSSTNIDAVLRIFKDRPASGRTPNHALQVCTLLYNERCACLEGNDSNSTFTVSNFQCFTNNETYWNRGGRNFVCPGGLCVCRCALHSPVAVNSSVYKCSEHCAFQKASCTDYMPNKKELECSFLHGESRNMPWFTGVPIIIACALFIIIYQAKNRINNCWRGAKRQFWPLQEPPLPMDVASAAAPAAVSASTPILVGVESAAAADELELEPEDTGLVMHIPDRETETENEPMPTTETA